MSTEQSYEPELVDQTRQQIRGLVSEIEGLARAQVSPEEFYEGFLHRVVAALAAIGGAIWTVDEEGRLALSAQINLAETRLHENQDDQQKHGKLLRKFLTVGQGGLVQPRYTSTEEEGSNPTENLLVLGILKSDQEVRGLVEVFQRTGGRPAVERGYLRFVMQMCDLAEDYLKTRQLRLYTDRQAIWTQLEQFTRSAHSSLEPRATAYTLANEGRRLIDCDRVSLAIKHGRSCRIEAVSGQETFDKRSNTVTLLGRLASVVVKAGEPLWFTGDTRDLAPQVEEAVEAYVDESHSKTIVVLPLAKPHDEADDEAEHTHHKPEYVGALIVEQINTDGVPAAMRRRIDVVAEHGSTALSNSLEHNSLFLMPVWRTLGKSRVLVHARTLPKTIAVIVLVLGVLLSLFFIPARFQLHGKGALQPVMKRDVFAGTEGTVTALLVKNGDEVKTGQPLVKMRSTDLESRHTQLLGDIAQLHSKIDSVQRYLHDKDVTTEQRYKLNGDQSEAESSLRGKEQELTVLEDKEKRLTVTSPIDGKVIGWKLEEILSNGRPIEKGQLLMTVADPNQDWELEINMPEDRMGHIRRAQREQHKDDLDVSYILATDPGRTLHGTLKEIHGAAEVSGEEGNTVLVRVKIDKSDLEPKDVEKGAGVSAKIDCGQRSLGYSWFHDVIEFIQTKILFRW
ncbi:MAG TPA: HlyD family efflux transporter periplasmic adaptor subunit [Pirellulales bacterium]|jgi:multidrug efflux pump subunit AcrA (membrane-fusion protein)